MFLSLVLMGQPSVFSLLNLLGRHQTQLKFINDVEQDAIIKAAFLLPDHHSRNAEKKTHTHTKRNTSTSTINGTSTSTSATSTSNNSSNNNDKDRDIHDFFWFVTKGWLWRSTRRKGWRVAISGGQAFFDRNSRWYRLSGSKWNPLPFGNLT